jgi:SNF2 family DNA or RNA helicase
MMILYVAFSFLTPKYFILLFDPFFFLYQCFFLRNRYNKRNTPPEYRKDLGKALRDPHRPTKHDLKVQEGRTIQETYTEEDNHFMNGNQLRSYQLEGLNWMLWNWKNQRNSILADEMGLGKTVQSVMFCNHLFEKTKISTKKHLKNVRNVGQFLIVAPLSVIPHWKREFESWTNMNTIVYHGDAEARRLIERYEVSYDEWDGITSIDKKNSKRDRSVCKFDVLITTYEMCHKDAAFFQAIPWRLLIVDEAHKLKNAKSNLSVMLRTINRNATLLLTGTPLQNDTKELW